MRTIPTPDPAALLTAHHRHAGHVALSGESALTPEDRATLGRAAAEHLGALAPGSLEDLESRALIAAARRSAILAEHPVAAAELVRSAYGGVDELTPEQQTDLEAQMTAHAKAHHAELAALDAIELALHDGLLASALRGGPRTMAEPHAGFRARAAGAVLDAEADLAADLERELRPLPDKAGVEISPLAHEVAGEAPELVFWVDPAAGDPAVVEGADEPGDPAAEDPPFTGHVPVTPPADEV